MCDRNPYPNQNQNHLITPYPPEGESEGFEEFWAAYGKVGSKQHALVAYDAALKRPRVTPSVLLTGAKRYRNDRIKRNKMEYYYREQGLQLRNEVPKRAALGYAEVTAPAI